MKHKNKDLDSWISFIRSPYERVFARRNKRARYSGIAKNQFAAFMQSLAFNLKRLAVIAPPDLHTLHRIILSKILEIFTKIAKLK